MSNIVMVLNRINTFALLPEHSIGEDSLLFCQICRVQVVVSCFSGIIILVPHE